MIQLSTSMIRIASMGVPIKQKKLKAVLFYDPIGTKIGEGYFLIELDGNEDV